MDKIVRYTVTLQAAIRQNNLSIIPVISHCFISFVLEMVAEKYHIDTISHYPDWLNDLIFEINKPENISAFPHDIVAKCNFSKTYIARTFKFYTGKTLIEYMTDVKIKHAWRLSDPVADEHFGDRVRPRVQQSEPLQPSVQKTFGDLAQAIRPKI